MDGPIVQADSSILIHPSERVLHPILVIPLGEILAGVSPAALGAGDGRIHQSCRLKKETKSEFQIIDRSDTAMSDRPFQTSRKASLPSCRMLPVRNTVA